METAGNEQIIKQREYEIQLLEIEKDIQLTLYRNSVGAANVMLKEIPKAMSILAEKQAEYRKIAAMPNATPTQIRQAHLGAEQAKANVAHMIDYQRRSQMEAMTQMALGMPGGSYAMPAELSSTQMYGTAWMAQPGFKSGSAQDAPTRNMAQAPYKTLMEQWTYLITQLGDNADLGTLNKPFHAIIDNAADITQQMPQIGK